MLIDKKIIERLLELSDECIKNDEVPVSAVIYDDNGIISWGVNRRNSSNKTFEHAEVVAILNANKKLSNWKLYGTNMLVTLEPCDMCKAIIKEARIKNVYYLLPRYSFKKQYNKTNFNRMEINSDIFDSYKEKMKDFFSNKRDNN